MAVTISCRCVSRAKWPVGRKLYRRVGNITLEGFGTCGDEVGIELTPDGEQWRLGGSEIFLKFRVELHVVRVVEEEIELDVDVAGEGEDGGVERVAPPDR